MKLRNINAYNSLLITLMKVSIILSIMMSLFWKKKEIDASGKLPAHVQNFTSKGLQDPKAEI